MSWTERQRLMLREMGLATWAPPAAAATTAAAPTAAEPPPPRPAVPSARPMPEPRAGAPTRSLPPSVPNAATPVASASIATPVAAPPIVADDDRARQIATLDWEPLRAAVADCQACGLCRTRTQTVFGVGDRRAGWMIVGEAPGEQEDLQGEPFVGASGELLDNMLRALRLTRSTDGPEPPAQRVYIANTLKCRPPRNRNPEPAELLACEPFLIRQVALLRPALILAMGRFAVQMLLRSSEPVGKLRGKVHTYQGVPLVVTYHPAYLLRNLPDKARAWDDLCLAAGVADRAVVERAADRAVERP
jgi:uracil-DNA glycosylase family 4